MSRYLLVAMAMLAASACAVDRTHRTASETTGMTPDHEMMSGRGRTASRQDSHGSTPSIGNEGNGDRRDPAPTAGDQSESDGDRRITRMIRQAVIADQELSMQAKNCTIVTIDGIVTIRGSVDNAAERRSIDGKAGGISGVRRVDNLLVIAP